MTASVDDSKNLPLELKETITMTDIGLNMKVNGKPKIMDLGDTQIKFTTPHDKIIAINAPEGGDVSVDSTETEGVDPDKIEMLTAIARFYAADTNSPSGINQELKSLIARYKTYVGYPRLGNHGTAVAQFGSRYKGPNKHKRNGMFFTTLIDCDFDMREENGIFDCLTRFNVALSVMNEQKKTQLRLSSKMILCVGGPLGKDNTWISKITTAFNNQQYNEIEFQPDKFATKKYRYIGFLNFLQESYKEDFLRSKYILMGPTGSNSVIVLLNQYGSAKGFEWPKPPDDENFQNHTSAKEAVANVIEKTYTSKDVLIPFSNIQYLCSSPAVAAANEGGGKSRSRRNKKQSKRRGKNNKKRKTSRGRKMRKTRRNNKKSRKN